MGCWSPRARCRRWPGGSASDDVLDRLADITWTGPGGTITSDQVTRRVGGNVVDQIVDGNDRHPGNDYTYDSAGRLTDAYSPGRHTSYRFDPTSGCGLLASAGANTSRTIQTIDGGTSTGY